MTNSLSRILLCDDINAPDDLMLEARYVHKNVLLKAQYLLAFPCKLNSEYWYKSDKIWVRRDASRNGKFIGPPGSMRSAAEHGPGGPRLSIKRGRERQ